MDAARVAQLRIKRPVGLDGEVGIASRDKGVLTAAHLVERLPALLVVFGPIDRRMVAAATVRLCASKGDVAILTIEPATGTSAADAGAVRAGRRT